jgi:hypothetical protein
MSKTTLTGLGLIAYAIGIFAGIAVGKLDGAQATEAIAAIMAGIGLIFAKDADPKPPVYGGRASG